MHYATGSVSYIIQRLSTQYNQATITTELVEIIYGAEAL